MISILPHINKKIFCWTVVLVCAICIPLESYAQFSNGYSFRKRVELNNADITGSTAHNNFPILFQITDSDLRTSLNGGFVENANGYDIIFTAADTTVQLDHQIESYNSSTGEFKAWVNIPSLDPNNTNYIYIYYGNSSVSTDPSSANTWNNNYQVVQHFNNAFLDATANSNNATNGGSTDIVGQIERARDFDGSNDDVQIPDDATLDITGQITISAWIYVDDYSNQPDLITKGDYTQSYSTWIDYNGTLQFYLNNNAFTSSTSITTGQWEYVTFTYNQSDPTIYINGTGEDVGNFNQNIGTTNTPLFFSNANNFQYNGRIDEARISNTAHSADWISTEFNIQSDPVNFVTYVNDPPLADNIEAAGIPYLQGDPPIEITSTLTIQDFDNTDIQSAEVAITSGYQSTEDVLAFTNQNGITGTFDSGTGILSLSGTATVAEYQAAIRSVTYENTSGSPTQVTRILSITANDGTDDSNTVARNLNIVAQLTDLSTDISNPVFHFDGQDINGDLNLGNQPGDGTNVGTWGDRSDNAGSSTDLSATNGTATQQPVFDSYYFGERGAILWDGTDDNLDPPNNGLLNTGAPYDEKSFAAVFRTGANTSGLQVIYEQGAGTRGYQISIKDGNAYAYTWNNDEWSAGDQNKSINLGSVQPNTSYIVLASHDATAGTLVNRTWSASINGGVVQTLNSTDVQHNHGGGAVIGEENGTLDPVTFGNPGGTSPFGGYVAELISWNTALNGSQIASVYQYLSDRWDNTPPVLSSMEGTDLNYTEGDAPTSITSTLSLSDADNTVMDSAYVEISGNYNPSEDELAFTNQNGITGSWNATTGRMTLIGRTTIANYETALRSITYENTNSVNPDENDRTVSFTVFDWDDPSNIAARNINIIAVNSAPSLSSIEGAVKAYTEGDGAVNITSTIQVSDIDDTDMQGATVQITGNYAPGQDQLAFTSANGITSSFNSSTGTLTLTGTSSITNYQAALRAVTYNNISPTPSTANRTFTFTVNDGDDNSNTQARDFTIASANNAPVLANIESSALSYEPNDPPTIITENITVSDADDSNIESATVEVTSGFTSGEDELTFTNILGITGSYNSGTGVLTLSGTATKANYETALQSVTYENTNGAPSIQTREISFTVNDGTDNSNTLTRNISLSIVQSISGLDLWLDASEGVITSGSEVVTWEDQSGNNRDYTGVAGNGNRPALASSLGSLNNKDAVQFAGDGDFMEDADGENYINSCSEFTIFFVIQSDLTGTDRGFWDTQQPDTQDDIFTIRYDANGANAGAVDLIKAGILGDSPDNQLESFSDIQTTDGQILSLDWESSNEYNLIVDGVLNNPSGISTPPTGTLNNASTAIVGKGAKDAPDTPGQSWDGYVAEVIYFCRYLDLSERQNIENYLSAKYGIAIRLIGPATNGEAIPADNFATGTYTSLDGPRLREDFIGELNNGGTIVFEAPSGFEWNTGSTPSVAIDPAFGSGTTLDISFTSITPTEITFTIDAESTTPGNPGEAVFSGLEVRPTQGTLPNTGNITNTGTTGPGGTTNYGTLTMVPGAADSLVYVQQPTNDVVSQSITPAIEVQVVDQFSNSIKNAGTNISAVLSSGTGTLSGTTSRSTNVTGKVFFDDLSIDQTGTKQLTVSSTGLTSAVSNNFEISDPSALSGFNVENVGGGNIVNQSAGQPFDIRVTAIDGTSSTKTDFTGTVEISSTGNLSNGAGTTANFTNGVLTSHSVTISNTGTFTITATNSSGPEDGTSNSFDVNAGAADETTSVISANPTFIANDGASTSTITVQLRDSEGNNLSSGGDNVQLSTNAGTLGGVTDNNDGTYTATLTSSTNNETATITGTLNTNTITDNAEVTFTQFDAIWEGSLGGGPPAEQWSNTDNWNNNAVPAVTDAVLIPEDPAVGNRYPVVQNADQTVGTLVIEQNADVTVSSNQTLTVNNDLSGDGEVNGSNSATLEVGGDLSITSISIGNVILNGSSLQAVTSPHQYQGLEIDNSNNVEVTENLFVDDVLTLTSGSLIIPSGKNIIANDQTGTGTLTFRRAVSGVPGWRMLSSPVNSTYGDLLDGTITQGYDGAFYDASVAPNDTLQPNVLYYDETFEGTDNQRFRAPASASTNLTEGRGFFLYVFGDVASDNRYNEELPDTLEVTGNEFEGNGTEVDFGVTYTAEADTGFNLVGNPYGATINWDDNTNWTKTNVNQTIYVWDPNANGGNGNFLTWNGTTGTLGSGLLAPFQGFWIKANAASPVLKVNEAAKTVDGVFVRKQAPAPVPEIKFQLEKEGVRPFHQEAFVMFSDDASREFDPKDAYRMIPFAQDFLELYFLQGDGTQISINNLPREFEHRNEIPISVGGIIGGEPATGAFTLSWPELKNLPPEWIVQLVDNKTNNVIDLRDQSFYTFDYETSKQKAKKYKAINSAPGKTMQLLDKEYDDRTRLTLVITTQEIESKIPQQLVVKPNYPNPFNPSTTIEFGLPKQSPITIEIYNVIGQLVTKLRDGELMPAGFHTVKWQPNALASGVYIYRIRTGQSVITKKMTFIK